MSDGMNSREEMRVPYISVRETDPSGAVTLRSNPESRYFGSVSTSPREEASLAPCLSET